MAPTRSVLALILALPLGGGGDALAAPLRADSPDASSMIEQVQRKGTRSYRPDGTTATDTEAASQAATVSRSEKLSQCMDTWDKGTHIAKDKWREICERQLDER